MSAPLEPKGWTFLYRQSEGTIDRREWILASAPVIVLLALMTLIWLAIMPRAPRDLAHQPLFDLRTAIAYLYLVVYAFAILLGAVAEYFVSAKRFADRGRPGSFAGLPLFAIFFAASANWYGPLSGGWAPRWLVLLIDALALVVVAWSLVELALLKGRR